VSEVTVGGTVASARERAGLTVAEVAEASRIRATLVSHIEQDDFSLCGGDVYARGHLRTIAAIVGLDPAALVAQYDAERGRVRPETAPVAPVAQPTRVAEADSDSRIGALAGTLGTTVGTVRQGPNWSAVMALALVVVLGLGLVSWLGGRSSDGGSVAAPSGSATPSTTPSASSESPTPSATPTPSPTDAVASASGVRVVIAVTGNASWISATAGTDGDTLFEGTLTEGQTRTFKDDDSVSLIIGNAGAVDLRVNGTDLGAPGGNGEVVRLEFGPGDPDSQAG
jgi:cytoskeletal protein RodZ